MDLSTWSPMRAAIWGGLGGVASLGENMSLRAGFEVSRLLAAFTIYSLCFVFVVRDTSSELAAPATMPGACLPVSLPSWILTLWIPWPK